MTSLKRVLWTSSGLAVGLSLACACGIDNSLREYLSVSFWLPFAKGPVAFEKPGVARISKPFAGMQARKGNGPLADLRELYRKISMPVSQPFEIEEFRRAVAAARSDRTLTQKEREEVDLIDAKIDLRSGQPQDPELLESAREKLEKFLASAQTPEFQSEGRGWLARVHFLLGNQTKAGKIYLDELNRPGSNLSRDTLLSSLQMAYGYDGGPQLRTHIEEYFDTAEHAAFAIQVITNPRWDRDDHRRGERRRSYSAVRDLLVKHSGLLQSESGADTLALLAMRAALAAGDPQAARQFALQVPAPAAIRQDPDFLWMSASAQFLSRRFAAAEKPLLTLFRSRRASRDQKAAAAYGLCGVYRKTGNVAEQLRYALWLFTERHPDGSGYFDPSMIEDLSIYWAPSGWDLFVLLESEASVEALQSFVAANPGLPQIRKIKYSLAVRLARENRYKESADLYASIHAERRAQRMRRLETLYSDALRDGPGQLQAKFRLAQFLAENQERIYFNDSLWGGYQRYALRASAESRMNRAERNALIEGERKLKDDQEERWRAYLILRDVMREAGTSNLARQSAVLAANCLAGISERFGRQEEILHARAELWKSLRPPAPAQVR